MRIPFYFIFNPPEMKTEAEKDWITKIYEVQAGDILFSESHRRYIAVHSIDADNYIY